MLRAVAAIALVACAACILADPKPVGFKVETNISYASLARSKFGGELFSVEGTSYKQGAPLIVSVSGNRTAMGYDWGFLVGKQSHEAYQSLLKSILGKRQPYLQPAVEAFLDWQWNRYLSKQVPQEFMEELEGVNEGGIAAGVKDLGKKCTRGIVLANLPSDIPDDLYPVFVDELLHHRSEMDEDTIAHFESLIQEIARPSEGAQGWFGMQCSMFAIWGDRTMNRRLFSARNLDWNKDTGINKFKLVSVFRPEGKHSHATIGFAGLFGALAGMSEKGLSVHEANLEEDKDSFRGFPWTIRLRYIMENSDSITSAKNLWEATNNTVGFNHMVASASDAADTPHGAIVFETQAEYTAYFLDNDVREQTATRVDKNNQTVQVGFPLEQALWRTNNGFDPISIKNYQWNLDGGAGQDSETRYKIIHDAFVSYNETGVKVDDYEAINVTAIVGSKGDDFFLCTPSTYDHGSNVLSVTFAPSDGIFYAAWEDGTNTTWSPACCNAYVRIDVKKFF